MPHTWITHHIVPSSITRSNSVAFTVRWKTRYSVKSWIAPIANHGDKDDHWALVLELIEFCMDANLNAPG